MPAHTRFTVVGREALGPRMTRIVLEGDDLSAFTGEFYTDRYVKLLLPVEGTTLPEPLEMESIRAALPAELHPVLRTYTVRSADIDQTVVPPRGRISIDFAIHPYDGVGTRWVRDVGIGTPVLVIGPGGAYHPDAAADWHLIAADDTALPAACAALEALPADAVGVALLEVEEPEDALPVRAPAGVEIRWLPRSEEGDDALFDAIDLLPWRDGDVHVFVHGEAHEVMRRIRPLLRDERGVDPERISISGYWRRGATEEGFRAWKRDLALDEGRRD